LTWLNIYDSNGSLIKSITGGTTNTYTYDVRNKMTAFAVNGTTEATYVYDDAGNRVKEIISGTTNYYLTDTQNPSGYAEPIETRSGTSTFSSTTLQTTYLMGTQPIGQTNSTGTNTYYVVDGHGSVRATTSSSGSVVSTFNYDAFGDPVNFTPSSSAPIFLFGGDAVYDYVSGLYMNGDGTRDRAGPNFIQADVLKDTKIGRRRVNRYRYHKCL
jgi:hypothetical protein